MQPLQFLDLNRDDISDATGKCLRINSADYVLLDQIAEGGEAFVFPIRNCRSGITSFVAKIYKFRPGSPEFAERLDPSWWKWGFKLECFGVTALHTEFYEIPGGLIRLQECIGRIEDPDYCEEQLRVAVAANKSGRLNEAAQLYQEVLRKNPNHVDAMVNLAGTLAQMNKVGEALAVLGRAKSIDPNRRDIYHQTATVFASIGHPTNALSAIDETLRRWKYDCESIRRQIKIALDFDRVTIVEQRLNEVRTWLGELGELAAFESPLTASKTRFTESRRSASLGVEAQRKQEWNTAKGHYSKASSITMDNAMSQLNEFVCRYHMGEAIDWKEIASLTYRLTANTYDGAVLLAILVAARANVLAQAGVLFEMLNRIEHPWDLPGVPIAYVEVSENTWGSIEQKSVMPLVDMLQSLLISDVLKNNSASAAASLLQKYKQREVLASK